MHTDTNRVHVNCRPEDAFDYVADITTHPLWSLDNIRVEQLTAGPAGVGSRFHTVGHSLVMERDLEAEIEIIGLERPGSLTFVARSGPREFMHVFTFRLHAGGTMIERAMTFEALPALADRLQAMGKVLDKRRVASLAMLKALLEEGSPAANL